MKQSLIDEYTDIERKKVNLPHRCFVTHATENYLPIVEYLIKSIRLFSDYKIVLYTINCDAEFDYDNLIKIRYDVEDLGDSNFIFIHDSDADNYYIDRELDFSYKILTLKPEIISNALNNGVNEGIYLDADMFVNNNIDDLFESMSSISNYPLATEGVFETMSFNGEFDIEVPLMKKLGVQKKTWYRQTGLFLFNKKCKNFIESWLMHCKDKEIVQNWREFAPYHEETIFNVLLWKNDYNKRLKQSYLNIINLDTIRYFEQVNVEKYYSEQMKRVPIPIHEGVDKSWLNFCKDKKQVKTFHGLKNLKELENIYKYFINKSLDISFSEEDGKSKIFIKSNANIKDIKIYLKDLDTNLTLYKKEYELFKGIAYWMMPNTFINQLSGIKVLILNTNNEFIGDRQIEYDIDNKIVIDNKNIKITANNNDEAYIQFRENFHLNTYESGECFIEEGDICLDLGANLGFFSLYALEKGASKVYAVEPVESTFNYLCKNTNFTDKIKCINCAAGSETKNSIIRFAEEMSGCSTLTDMHNNTPRNFIDENIKVVNINELLEKHNIDKIDFLKIDVEGFEYDILKELSREFLKKNVKKIAIELHNFKDKIDTLKYKLKDCNYIYNIVECENGFGYLYAINTSFKIDGDFKAKCNFVNGPYVEVLQGNDNYNIEFIDSKNNEIVHSGELRANHWIKANRQWYTDWFIKITKHGETIWSHKFDLNNKIAYIKFESKSLGDNIAWMPYVKEFKEKHNCKVYVSTFWNHLFKESYPEINFVEPGDSVEGVYASYKIGCFNDCINANKNKWNTIPLQQVATDILGLNFEVIKPNISIPNIKNELLETSKTFVEISNGELVDKLSILQIKKEKIKDNDKLKNVEKEYNALFKKMEQIGVSINSELYKRLYDVNCELWDIEDKIRKKEMDAEFDAEFIKLARSVYFKNDKRANIKKEINVKTKSNLIEEKDYIEYGE